MTTNKEILFNPFPKQIEFLEAVFCGLFSFVLFGGAIRGGKTFAGLGALILLCRMFPGSRWAVVRDTLPTLKRNTIPSWEKIKPKAFIKSYNQETQTITMVNGSQIIFFPQNYENDKEWNRWKGLEVNGFLLEEINELQKKAFTKAIERAGSHIITSANIIGEKPEEIKQPKPMIIATCNPTNNWVKDLIYTPWKHGELNPKWKYIPARIFDNPFISQDYIDNLNNMPKHEYEVFVNGDWDVNLKTGGEFYKSFDIEKHTETNEYDPAQPLHISFDENVNPYITATVWQVEGKKLKQIKEFCLETPQNTVRKLCEAIAIEYRGHLGGGFIYGDATSKKQDTKLEKGHNFFTLIRDYLIDFRLNLRVPASNPSVVMRGNFINQVWDKGFMDIEIIIDRDCKESVADYMNVKEDSDGKKKKTKIKNPETGVTYEEYGHTSDANDYFICEVLKTEFGQYSTGRKTFDHVSIGFNQPKKNTY
jgi:hypothetical protein